MMTPSTDVHTGARRLGLLTIGFLLLAVFLFIMTPARGDVPPAWFKNATPGFSEERWDDFMSHVNAFQRKLKGCEPVGYPPVITCNNGAEFDIKEWRAIRDRARPLFADTE